MFNGAFLAPTIELDLLVWSVVIASIEALPRYQWRGLGVFLRLFVPRVKMGLIGPFLQDIPLANASEHPRGATRALLVFSNLPAGNQN